MTAEQFAYWLQGFAELGNHAPTEQEWQSIREHLATVFVKVTPPLSGWKPGQVAYPLQRPTSAKDAPFIHELMRSECKGTVLASGDGDTRLC